jgi:phosphatidate cytidylyltransferase
VAVVLLPVVLVLVYLGGWWLFALVAAAALLALHEFWLMARSLRPLALAGYLGGAAALAGAQLGGVEWALGGFVLTLPLAFVLKGLAETRTTTTAAVGATVLGTAWIGLGLAHMLLLREVETHGTLLAFTVLLAVFAADTVAYFVGRLIGRHKLAPVVSPGKTWEGLIAGTVVAIAVPFFALYEDRREFLAIWETLVLGAAIAVAAPLGDLFESALKRDMQVKDTGRLLGGHGGMLDRIDALLFTAFAAYYTVAALGHA